MYKEHKLKMKRLFIVSIAIAMSAFFGFFNYIFKGIYSTDQQAVFVILISLMCLFSSDRRRLIIHKRGYFIENFLYVSMIIISIILPIERYNQPLVNTLKESIYYFASIISYYAFKKLFKETGNIGFFKKTLVVCSIICCLVSFVEYAFLIQGIDILQLDTYIKFRYDTPRFEIGTMVIVLSLFISTSSLLYGKHKKSDRRLYFTNIVLSIINLIIIVKTRSLIFYLIIAILSATLINGRQLKRHIKILLGLGIVVSIGWLIGSNLISSVNFVLQEDMGVAVRYKAIDYYWQQFLEKPLFGLGFISGSDRLSSSLILLGSNRNFNRSDVGIVGFINEFGILGIIWIISWFKKTIVKLKESRENINDENYVFNCYFLIFLLITCTSMIFTDMFRFMYMPVMMTFVEAYSKPNKE